jgi:hypothetical protein
MAGLHRGRKAGTMVEGEQHVVNRRAVGHGGASLGGSVRLSSSHETAVLSTPWWLECEYCGSPGQAEGSQIQVMNYLNGRGSKDGLDSRVNLDL